jgi:hypothetical protein
MAGKCLTIPFAYLPGADRSDDFRVMELVVGDKLQTVPAWCKTPVPAQLSGIRAHTDTRSAAASLAPR